MGCRRRARIRGCRRGRLRGRGPSPSLTGRQGWPADGWPAAHLPPALPGPPAAAGPTRSALPPRRYSVETGRWWVDGSGRSPRRRWLPGQGRPETTSATRSALSEDVCAAGARHSPTVPVDDIRLDECHPSTAADDVGGASEDAAHPGGSQETDFHLGVCTEDFSLGGSSPGDGGRAHGGVTQDRKESALD